MRIVSNYASHRAKTLIAAITLLLVAFIPVSAFSKILNQSNHPSNVVVKTLEPQSLEVPLPIMVNGVERAVEVVKITTDDNPKILFFYSRPMIELFEELLTPEEIEPLRKFLNHKVRFKPKDLEKLGITVNYDRLGAVNLTIPLQKLKNKDITFGKKDLGMLIPNTFPTSISGQLSLSGQNNYSTSKDSSLNQSFITAVLSLNTFGAVINSGVKKNDTETNRSETNIAFPISKYSQLILGDIISIGDTSTQISGVGFSRLSDSSTKNLTSMSQTIVVPTLSKIEVYRNETLIKEFQANPGRVSFSDLPISIGNNLIRIVITDVVTGKKSEEVFSDFIPLIGEKKGGYSFIVAAGKTRKNTNDQISYLNGDSLLSDFKYGVTNNLTAGINAKINDYSGLLGLNQTLVFKNYSMRFSEFKGVSVMGVQDEYQANFSKTNNMPLLNNISLEAKKIIMDKPVYSYTDSTFSANASFKPFFDIYLTTGYNQYHLNSGEVSSESFASLGRKLYIGRNLSVSGSLDSSFGSNQRSSHTEVKLNFTYQDTLDAGRVSVYGASGKNSSHTQATLKAVEIDYSAGYSVPTNAENASKSLGLSKSGYLGTIAGVYNNTRDSSTYLMSGSTAIYFAGSNLGFGRPLSESFLIIENEGRSGGFEVSNRYGDAVSRGQMLSSAVVPVGNYSLSSFNANPEDVENYSLELTKSYIYQSGYRSGGAVKFSNSKQILVIAKVVDETGSPLGAVDLDLICKKHGRKIKQALFTDSEGSLSFSGERGSKCRLSTPEYESKEIGLDFMVKYKEIDNIKLLKKKGSL